MILKEPQNELVRTQNEPDRPPEYADIAGDGVGNERVNKISILTHVQDITGTYFIDPDLPVSDGNALKKGRPSKKRSRQANPNASFRTRRGTININLAILGSPTGVSKAMVELTTHRSDIAVNLLSLQPSKHISLEATTRHGTLKFYPLAAEDNSVDEVMPASSLVSLIFHPGNIVVLLPRSFCGALQLRSPKGHLKFLPVLASSMRVMHATNEEALVLIGETSNAPSGSASPVADYCKLTSRHGKVVVGVSGEDKYMPEQGFWKWLGSMVGYDHSHDRQLPFAEC